MAEDAGLAHGNDLLSSRIVPVISIDDPARADDLARALSDGGLPIAEITLRTESAVVAMTRVAAIEGFTVGAGTVTQAHQVDEVAAAGATFIVSPGLSEAVAERCQALGLPLIPGVMTPTEVQRALELGLDTLKFFPAEAAGGTRMLAAMRGPFPRVSFVPTGGITAANFVSYLEQPNVASVGGSWLAPASDIALGQFSAIAERTREAVALVQDTTPGVTP